MAADTQFLLWTASNYFTVPWIMITLNMHICESSTPQGKEERKQSTKLFLIWNRNLNDWVGWLPITPRAIYINMGRCGSGVEPESCYRNVARLIPLVSMSRCPWVRNWTLNRSWCDGRHFAWQPPPSMYKKCLLKGLNVKVTLPEQHDCCSVPAPDVLDLCWTVVFKFVLGANMTY